MQLAGACPEVKLAQDLCGGGGGGGGGRTRGHIEAHCGYATEKLPLLYSCTVDDHCGAWLHNSKHQPRLSLLATVQQ